MAVDTIARGMAASAQGSAGGTKPASDITYDNSTSGLSATNVQAAIDELDIGIDERVPTVVEAWLEEHVDPETGYVIDNSLSVAGAAADAKAVGNKIADLNNDLQVSRSIVSDYLIHFAPYSRQIFNVATMLPSPPYILTVNSSLKVVSNSSFRLYVIEVNALAGTGFTYNFCTNGDGAPQNFSESGIYASNVLPAENQTVLQAGSSNTANMRGNIILAQDSKYIIIKVKSTVATWPTDPYTASCNALMGHIVLRKNLPNDTTYYEYAECPVYAVVPYSQGAANVGKILKVSASGVLELVDAPDVDRQEVEEIIENTAVLLNQGSENDGKVLAVGSDGLVYLVESAESLTPDVAVRFHPTKMLYVGDDLLTDEAASLGAGWSGNLSSGFTHASGNAAALTFSTLTTSGSAYLVTIESGDIYESNVTVAIGSSPKVDIYNGGSIMQIGIVSDGGSLSVYPASTFTGTIRIKLRLVQNSGTAITVSALNTNYGQTSGNLTGFWNVALGYNAMLSNQNGSRNIAIGQTSMQTLKSGTRNVAIGTFSMPWVTEGDRNVAVGADALYSSSSAGPKKAYDNVAIGKGTLKSGSEVKNNVAIGSGAIGNGTDTSQQNVSIGSQAGNYAKQGNAHIGYRAGYYTKGDYNVSLGCSAGSDLYNTGDNNVCIGHNAGTSDPTASSSDIKTISNAIAIGYDVKATKSNQACFGNSSQEIVLGGRKIVFNNDGTVSWEAL